MTLCIALNKSDEEIVIDETDSSSEEQIQENNKSIDSFTGTKLSIGSKLSIGTNIFLGVVLWEKTCIASFHLKK